MNKQIQELLEQLQTYQEALKAMKLEPNADITKRVLEETDETIHLMTILSSKLHRLREVEDAGC